MSRWMVCVGLMVAVGFLAATVVAQDGEGEKKPAEPRATGHVKGVDKEARTITVMARTKRGEEPKEMTFDVNDETKIVAGREAEAKALDDVTEGAMVMIVYAEAEGKLVAKQVRIMPPREGGKAKKEEKAQD